MLTHAQLVERGCLCGTDRISCCPLHGAGDNRGIAAFFRAGMPQAFPLVAVCAICGTDGLLYPDVQLDDPKCGGGEPATHRPTLICPRCSSRRAELALVAEVEHSGLHRLNERRVFA